MRTSAAVPGRTAGLLLLLVAVLTAVIAPRFAGTLTGGSAQAARIDPPPRIGSCVSGFTSPTGSAGAGASPGVSVPSASFGPCTGAIAGEVVSVQEEADLGDRLSASAYDSASAGCSRGLESYFGLPTGLNGSLSATQWLPAARYNTSLIGPDHYQRAAGRTWSACVLTSVASATYTGPVRGALRGGSLAASFGYCLGSIDLSDWVPCSTPHSAQVLAWGTAVEGHAMPAASECRAVAALLMQTKDPAEGGSLEVGLISYGGAGSVQACGIRVVGSRHLVGSLFGVKEAAPVLTG